MMEQKPRFLIYSRKEIAVLTLLVLLIAALSFTYGLHMGKKITQLKVANPSAETETPLVGSVQDNPPGRQELDAESEQVEEAAQETATQALKEEVTRTGLKVDKERQVELPRETKAEKPAAKAGAPAGSGSIVGRYALQMGSYPTVAEAKARVKELKAKGLPAFSGAAEVSGKTHFRVYAGGFATHAQAEEAGKSYVIKDWIDSFLVVPLPKN